jgi:hypothetical protein
MQPSAAICSFFWREKKTTRCSLSLSVSFFFCQKKRRRRKEMAAQPINGATARLIADAWIAHINGARSPGDAIELARDKARNVDLQRIYAPVLKELLKEIVKKINIEPVNGKTPAVARTGLLDLKAKFSDDKWLEGFLMEQSADPRDKFAKAASIMFYVPPDAGDFNPTFLLGIDTPLSVLIAWAANPLGSNIEIGKTALVIDYEGGGDPDDLGEVTLNFFYGIDPKENLLVPFASLTSGGRKIALFTSRARFKTTEWNAPEKVFRRGFATSMLLSMPLTTFASLPEAERRKFAAFLDTTIGAARDSGIEAAKGFWTHREADDMVVPRYPLRFYVTPSEGAADSEMLRQKTREWFSRRIEMGVRSVEDVANLEHWKGVLPPEYQNDLSERIPQIVSGLIQHRWKEKGDDLDAKIAAWDDLIDKSINQAISQMIGVEIDARDHFPKLRMKILGEAERLAEIQSSQNNSSDDGEGQPPQKRARFTDAEITAALRATGNDEVAAAALLKKGKKTWQ